MSRRGAGREGVSRDRGQPDQSGGAGDGDVLGCLQRVCRVRTGAADDGAAVGCGGSAVLESHDPTGLDGDLLVYIGMPLGMLVAVHSLLGWPATLLVIGTGRRQRSIRHYTGRLLGRRPLAPAISPKKTIEGAVGGVIFGTVFMAAVGARVLPFSGYGPLIILGLLVVVFGICGDLFESRLKRTAGMKDSSSLIPVTVGSRSHRRVALRGGAVLSLRSKRHVKRLAILGSTGSIGRSALAVVDAHPSRLRRGACRRRQRAAPRRTGSPISARSRRDGDGRGRGSPACGMWSGCRRDDEGWRRRPARGGHSPIG